MKKVLLCFGLVVLGASLATAEPLVLEQAGNVLSPGTLEAGVMGLSWQSDKVKLIDDSGAVLAEVTNTALTVPLFARYAFTPSVEGYVYIPWLSVSVDAAGATDTTSGLADPVLAGKYTFAARPAGWTLSAMGIFSIPAGSDDFRKGFDIQPLAAARKTFGKYAVNLNLAYDITGKHDDIEEQDVLTFGAGVERPAVLAGKDVTLVGEVLYRSLIGKATYLDGSGALVRKDENGSRLDLVVGGRYNPGSWKTMLGLALSLGDEAYREYDYKVIAGVSYLFTI